ncbi:MAG: WYL domain-containing protein [Leptospiraceae bacterium]|nr:WYL domain-containing protein [Leptospiraceae bacterium]MCP5496610.1 WYL domain-containing protein [Leptospiraceae bacterium]
MKKYKDNPQEISLNYLKEILDIIGLIETNGKFYKQKSTLNGKITETEINNILLNIQNFQSKDDWGRTIKTAKKIFNSTCKNFEIKGSRSGTGIQATSKKIKQEEIVKDLGYQTLLILALALMNTNNSLNIDFLNQLLSQKEPLSLILFLNYAIQTKLVITFDYKSNRAENVSTISKFVPVKINFRDGHWLLIGWNVEKTHWNQYLIHSLLKIEPSKNGEEKSNGQNKKIV